MQALTTLYSTDLTRRAGARTFGESAEASPCKRSQFAAPVCGSEHPSERDVAEGLLTEPGRLLPPLVELRSSSRLLRRSAGLRLHASTSSARRRNRSETVEIPMGRVDTGSGAMSAVFMMTPRSNGPPRPFRRGNDGGRVLRVFGYSGFRRFVGGQSARERGRPAVAVAAELHDRGRGRRCGEQTQQRHGHEHHSPPLDQWSSARFRAHHCSTATARGESSATTTDFTWPGYRHLPTPATEHQPAATSGAR